MDGWITRSLTMVFCQLQSQCAVQCRTGSRQQQQGKDCILIMGLAAGAVQRGSGAGDRIINDKGSSNIHIDQVHHR